MFLQVDKQLRSMYVSKTLDTDVSSSYNLQRSLLYEQQ